MKLRHSFLAALALGALTLAGCPALQPRFDATGEYAGDYTVGIGKSNLLNGCGIQLELEHDVKGLPILNAKVGGTVTLHIDCLLPEDLAGLAEGNQGVVAGALAVMGFGQTGEGLSGLSAIPPVEVAGVLLPDGTLELNTPEILKECNDGDCMRLGMVGRGVDEDGDGKMDRFSGTYAGMLGKSMGNLPITGTFDTHSGGRIIDLTF